MDQIGRAIQVLRKELSQAKKQYRYANDNSGSLFHPAHGFVEAYDSAAVHRALSNLELNLPTQLAIQG